MLSLKLGIFLVISGVAACAAGDTPEDLLARFQDKVRQDFVRVPNYTCLETMQRSERKKASRPFDPGDTVRIEVSSVGGKELYAWPGSRQFDDKDMNAFIASGATASGVFFSVIPNTLFIARKAALEYRGEEDLAAHRSVRYDYRIARPDSGLQLTEGDISVMVAVRGSFWFDPVTLDLIRLDAYADDMPAALNLSEALLSIRYGRARIGNSDALLPRQGEVTMTRTSGAANHIDLRFSQCRAYQTESTVSFEAPADPGVASSGVRQTRLPAGLLVPVVLETALNSETAALGDAVRARVRDNVRRDGEVVLPAGAVISARVRRLDRAAYTSPYFVLGVELFEVEWGNQRADFYGELVESYGAKKGVSAGGGTRGSVTYILQGKTFRIEPGLSLLWRILDRPPEAVQQPR